MAASFSGTLRDIYLCLIQSAVGPPAEDLSQTSLTERVASMPVAESHANRIDIGLGYG